MTEADVWRVIISVLRAGLDAQGFNSLLIKQSFQPRKTGVDSQDTVYLFKVTSNRVGAQGKSLTYNDRDNEFDGVSNYWLESTFQLTAIIERDITNSSALTSYDVADVCSAILQTEPAIVEFNNSGIGILRITELRNPFGVDDRDQFDQSANFDFSLTYNQSIGYVIPMANRVEPDVQVV